MRRWLVVAIGAVLACGSPDQFSLSLGWSAGPSQACPASPGREPSCTDIALSCEALAQIKIIDATDDSEVYYDSCFTVPPGADLCGLRDVALPGDLAIPNRDFFIPNRMVRIRVLVWSKEELERQGLARDQCPAFGHFDQRGFPQLNLDLQPPAPVPALGREVYFPVGDRENAVVELGCSDDEALDTLACRTRSLRVDALVIVPRIWQSVSEAVADTLTVRFGPTSTNANSETILSTRELVSLVRTNELDGLHWIGTVAGPIDGLRCVEVDSQSPVFPTATCRQAAALPSGDVPFTAYHLEPAIVNTVGRLIGRELPTTGIVIGFVIDRQNQPVVGAVVTGVAPGDIDATVRYPTTDLTGWQAATADEIGMFVSTDAPIGTVWRATAPGLQVAGAFGGIITNHTTAVVLPMDPAQ